MKNKFSALHTRMSPESRARADAKASALLDVLARDIDERPEVLRPIEAEFVGRLHSLAGGLEVDLDQPLPPELGDAGMP